MEHNSKVCVALSPDHSQILHVLAAVKIKPESDLHGGDEAKFVHGRLLAVGHSGSPLPFIAETKLDQTLNNTGSHPVIHASMYHNLHHKTVIVKSMTIQIDCMAA